MVFVFGECGGKTKKPYGGDNLAVKAAVKEFTFERFLNETVHSFRHLIL